MNAGGIGSRGKDRGGRKFGHLVASPIAYRLTVILALLTPALAQIRQISTDITLTSYGSISGTIVDKDGALISNVRVSYSREDNASRQEALSNNDGYFILKNLAPGPFKLVFNIPGFGVQEKSGILHAGENYLIPQVTLAVAATSVDVEVRLSPEEVAQEQIRVEEKQRLFGVIPNYYVSYVRDAAPLTPRQKFELAWKTTLDPVSFGLTGVTAGIEQAVNAYGAYGQGLQGYAKRYGAAYGDFVSGTFIGGAILPSLLKQDPRYFWKGSGTRKSRVLYAVANSVVCKGDNGQWQPNYSGILGGLAAGGISNLYYPAADRQGARLMFENTLIGTAGSAAGNIIQEFFLRKLTPHTPTQEPPAN